jgi:arsenate reductase
MALTSGDETLLILNPRCSKCRAAKALLEERGIEFRSRIYLEQPLSRAELDELGGLLGKPATQWVRSREDAFKAAGLDETSDEGAIKDAMVGHPILLERPILVRGGRAVIGRPPEDILELLA